MTRRPIAIALALLLAPLGAQAEDLLQTYDLARNSDPAFAEAEARQRSGHEAPVQARAKWLPAISGSVSSTYSDGTSWANSGASAESYSGSRSYRVGLSQSLFDLSDIHGLRSARANYQAADYAYESAGDDLITRTSSAYFSVLIAMETLSAAEAREAALKKQFDFASKRLEVGLAPITDVHEARAQYDGARASTLVTRNALEDAYRALEEITGREIRDLRALPQDFKPELPGEKSSEDWVQTALDNNPSLKAAELALQADNADVAAAKAKHLPTLDLSADYSGKRGFADGTGPNLPRNSAGISATVTLKIPLFSGGATQSGVRSAIAQRDQTQDKLELAKRGLVRSTRNAYNAVVAGISEVEARKAAVFSARKAYEASQVGLEVGTRTVLDVLNNQQTLFNAESEYAKSRYSFLQNRLLLEKAAGTLDMDDLQAINALLTVDAEAEKSP